MKKFFFVICLFLCLSNLQAQKQKLYGNRYLKSESKSTHSVWLNIGYNAINDNHFGTKSNLKGLPLGIAYEFCKNNRIYAKLQYTNFAITSFSNQEIIPNPLMETYIITENSMSQHLLSATIGLINSNLEKHSFQAGITGGYLLTLEKYDITSISNKDKDNQQIINQNESNNSGDIYAGIDLMYKYFFTDNLFLGLQGNIGYLFDYEKVTYSYGLSIGWKFIKHKQYKF